MFISIIWKLHNLMRENDIKETFSKTQPVENHPKSLGNKLFHRIYTNLGHVCLSFGLLSAFGQLGFRTYKIKCVRKPEAGSTFSWALQLLAFVGIWLLEVSKASHTKMSRSKNKHNLNYLFQRSSLGFFFVRIPILYNAFIFSYVPKGC